MKETDHTNLIKGRKHSWRDKFSSSFQIAASSRFCELDDLSVGSYKLTGLLSLHPKSFGKNECDKYNVNHMQSLRKNFERSWASFSYDAKGSRVVNCH
jgi:hypothetical protein